jgi:signal transduction histidine kinase
MQFTLHTAFQGIRAELDDVFVKLSVYDRQPRERLLTGLVTNLYVFAPIQSRPADHIDKLDALLAELRKQAIRKFQPDGDNRHPFIWALTANTVAVIQLSPLSRNAGTTEYTIVELNLEAMRRNLLPDLIRKYLGNDESDYSVAVLSKRNPNVPIYGADLSSSVESYSHADERALLYSVPSWSTTVVRGSGASSGSPFVQGFDSWELLAKHKQGSLAAAAGEVRRKWLTINFIVLMVLALGMVTIVVAALRAQNFLRLQMEFVAGVSHELRTPVSVISSAADNLAEGMVRSGSDVREYGALILNECRRLSGLVEQTLHFSASRANYRPRNLQFVNLAEVVGRALSAVSAVI